MSFYVSEIKRGAPSTFVSDIQRQIYNALNNSGIPYCRVESDPGITMDDCLNIDRAMGVNTVKTILLTNRQKNKFWLYITHARKPFITKNFSSALQIPRVSFADEQLMLQLIATKHGAATPFGLLNDTEHKINFVMDRDIALRESIVITDGQPCGFICIKNQDLFKLLNRKPILIDNNTEEN